MVGSRVTSLGMGIKHPKDGSLPSRGCLVTILGMVGHQASDGG